MRSNLNLQLCLSQLPKYKGQSSERISIYNYSNIVFFYVCWSAKNAIEVEICRHHFLYT